MLILISAFVGHISSHTQNQLGECQWTHLALPDSGSVLKRHSEGVKLVTRFSQSITHPRSPFQAWGKSSKLAQKRGDSSRCIHPLRSLVTQVPFRSVCNYLRPRILWHLLIRCLAFSSKVLGTLTAPQETEYVGPEREAQTGKGVRIIINSPMCLEEKIMEKNTWD